MNILRNYRFLAQTVKTLYLEPKQEKPIQPNFAPFNNTNKSIWEESKNCVLKGRCMGVQTTFTEHW